MSFYPPPKVPQDKASPFVDWLAALVRWGVSERVLQIKGFTLQQTNNGKVFVPPFVPQAQNGQVRQFKIVSDGGDWWVCNTFDGTITGSVNYYVVKPYKLRAGMNGITTETIRSSTYNYTYAPQSVGGVTGYYTRAVTGAKTETDYTIPDPLASNIIYAANCSTKILTSNGPPANPDGSNLIDLNADGRAWST